MMIDTFDERWEWVHRRWYEKYDESDPGFGIAGIDPAWYANCMTEREYGFVKRGQGEYEITDPDKFGRAFNRP